MSIHRLVALLGRALATCCARLHPLVIVPLRAFLPAPLTYDLACLHSEWYCQREASRGERIIHYLEEFLYRLIIVPLVAFLRHQAMVAHFHNRDRPYPFRN